MLHLGSTYLIVNDMEKSISFYQKLLNMNPTAKNFDRWVQFDFEGKCIALYSNKYDERLIKIGNNLEEHYNEAYLRYFEKRKIICGNNVVLNFWIEDLIKEYQRIKSLQIGEVSELMYLNISSPYHFFTVTDPDGNTIEVTGGYDPDKHFKMNYIIRKIKQSEITLLKDLTYEAIFQRDENNLIPKDVLEQPDIKVFYDDFGKHDDLCLVAEVDCNIVGAVWTRILSGKVKGFGNIDSETPEFAISLYKEYRGKGIGTALMQSMIKLLREHGYKKTSLAVQKDNYAVKMYQNVGFSVVKELDEEYLMVHNLN